MKREEFIKYLLNHGCVPHRHGSRLDIYLNSATGQKQPVPRHTEIHVKLVNHIKKNLGLILNETIH